MFSRGSVVILQQLYELQEQTNVYAKDLRGVKSRIANLQHSQRVDTNTMGQINGLGEDTNFYRMSGKVFIRTPRKDMEDRLEKRIADSVKQQRELGDREEYLERRIASNSSNIRDLTSGM